MWQDIIYGIGGLVFAVALLPAVFSKSKPPLSTSVMTLVTLAIFSVASLSLNLYLAAVTQIMAALMWGTLAVQKLRSAKPKI